MRPVRAMTNEAACPAGSSTHTIRRGESLTGIANAYALTLDELLEANPGVNPYAYYAGTVLCIPALQTIDCCEGRLYCVQLADTVQGISAAFGITESELTEANPILLQTGLIPGQIICIPLTPQPPELCPGAVAQIVITQGTVFSDVLIAYDISYSALQSVNPEVDLTNLAVGQSLCIPEGGTRGTCGLCETTYTLVEGDTLQSVAAALETTIGELMRKNPIALPSDFVAGTMICV